MEAITRKTGKFTRAFWWVSAFLLFLIIFATTPRVYYVLVLTLRNLSQYGIVPPIDAVAQKTRFLREIVAPIRGLLFLISLIGLLPPLIRDIVNSAKNTKITPVIKIATTLFIFVVLCILMPPGKLSGGNLEYADQSGVIFDKGKDVWSFQRFLMPATAYMLFFRGQIFFWIFSLLCVIAMVYLIQLWFTRNQIPIKNWHLISILTSGFLASKLQYPGTPDAFAHSFLLLLFIFPLGELAELSLLVFSISSHEASIILFSVVALFFKERRMAIKYFLVMFMYILIWLFSIRFDLNVLYHTPQIREFVPFFAIINSPKPELLGLFYGYKLLWILIFASLILTGIKQDYRKFIQIIALIGSGFLMTLMGVDTTRMFAWSFYALPISIQLLFERNDPRIRKLMTITFAFNLLIAPVYVDLYGGRPTTGLYHWLYSLLGL